MLHILCNLFIPLKFILVYYLLISNLDSFAQAENTATGYFVNNRYDNFSQTYSDYPKKDLVLTSIQKVDSIAHTTGVSAHFAKVYSTLMQNTAFQMQSMDTAGMRFVKKFEIGFADYFLNACYDAENSALSPGSEWTSFFSNPDAQPWQFVLLGVNAHINVNIWQTLVNNFSEEEIRDHKKQLLSFKNSVAKVYHPFFDELLEQNGYLRFINSLTKGSAEIFGEKLLFKWRQRQVNLAIMYYQNPKKFNKRLAVVNRKKQKIDSWILRKRKSAKLVSSNA